MDDGDTGGEVKLTEYVVTRWWRAPEVRKRGGGEGTGDESCVVLRVFASGAPPRVCW